MTSYWFKRRRYGWGWVPVTWQGWAVIIGFVVLVVGGALTLGEADDGVAGFLVYVAVLVVALFAISRVKGPSPRWRWGRTDADDPATDH
ncbi:MAG TPA: hypothetical protein VGE38_10020 [Nocardioides sp.]|uniref:hypothetical protein n=1 Tax=Nocardioides sp. TaxID=35761 RepID=UPI002EDB3167